MKLITTAVALFGLIASAFSQTGTNLVTNGNFNGLAPWTANGPVAFPSAGIGLILQGGTPDGTEISQTIPTTAGSAYYLSLRVMESSVTEPGNSSLWLDAKNSAPPYERSSYLTDTQKPGHYAWIFKASSPQTTIRIGVSNAEARIVNVSLVELPASPYAGQYTGIAKVNVAVSLEGPDESVLSATKTQRVVARVLSTGQFMVLRDTDEIATGILFSNGNFVLQANGRRMLGQAVVSGKRLTLTAVQGHAEDGGRTIRDEGQARVQGGETVELNLTRKGR
jgi:hypothetical protein